MLSRSWEKRRLEEERHRRVQAQRRAPSSVGLVVLADRNAGPLVAAHGGRPLYRRRVTLAEEANSARVIEEQIRRAAASMVDLHDTAARTPRSLMLIMETGGGIPRC